MTTGETTPLTTPATPPRLRDIAIKAVVVMLVVLSFGLLLTIRNVLVATFLGILLATALRPIVNQLRAWRVPRAAAPGLVMMVLVASVAGALVLTLPIAFSQTRTLMAELPARYSDIRTTLIESRYRIVRQFGENLRPSVSLGSPSEEEVFTQTINIVPVVGGWMFGIVSTLLFTYYWLLYHERSITGMVLLFPMAYREHARQVWIQVEEKIGAFIRGQAILSVVTGLCSLIGYWLIGLPYFFLMAGVAAVLELIPFIGPILITLIATAVGFSVSEWLGFQAIVVGVIIQQLENNLLAPRVMDKAVGVSPVVTLLSLVGFGALFGVGGVLLAIPLAAVLQVVFAYWIDYSMQRETETKIQGRGAVAHLRYQVQELSQDVRQRLRSRDDEQHTEVDQLEEELEDVLRNLDVILQQSEEETV